MSVAPEQPKENQALWGGRQQMNRQMANNAQHRNRQSPPLEVLEAENNRRMESKTPELPQAGGSQAQWNPGSMQRNSIQQPPASNQAQPSLGLPPIGAPKAPSDAWASSKGFAQHNAAASSSKGFGGVASNSKGFGNLRNAMGPSSHSDISSGPSTARRGSGDQSQQGSSRYLKVARYQPGVQQTPAGLPPLGSSGVSGLSSAFGGGTSATNTKGFGVVNKWSQRV